MIVKRGDIFYADLSPVVGSEQGGVRPVLVIQNNIGNKHSPTVMVAAITSQINKAKLPTHIEINAKQYGLPKDSVILLEQVRTIDKKRLTERIGICKDEIIIKKIEKAIRIQTGMMQPKENLNYINSLKKKILDLDLIIKKCKSRGLNYDDEITEKIFLIAELKIYCDEYCIDYRRFIKNTNKIISNNKFSLASVMC